MLKFKKYCADNDLRCTTSRQAAFAVLKGSRKALTAYNILARMHCNGHPPTVYRALDFLIEHSFAIRIHSVNAYVLKTVECKDVHVRVCKKCLGTEQLHVSISGAGFALKSSYTEDWGVCKRCLEKENRS